MIYKAKVEERVVQNSLDILLQVRAQWLLHWAATAGFGPDVATAVAKVVLAGGSADQLAAELLDLMGDAAFESIQALLAVKYVSTWTFCLPC